MNIYHFSDTHTYHNLLKQPNEFIDIAIFSGDCSNHRDPYNNEVEVRGFIDWYKSNNSIQARYKIFVAGNHDTSIEKGLLKKQDFTDVNIIYLENEEIDIEGVKIWGSPLSPNFGNWSFMRDRGKLNKYWQHIPEDTDILITHTPPKGILDLSYNRENILETCGCSSLMKQCLKIKPKLHLFGHIHNNKDLINAGQLKLSNYPTIFSNGSVVTDRKFGTLTSHGNYFVI